MSAKLEDLLEELIVKIFLCLTASDIQVCRLISKRFNAIVQSTPTLQFALELDSSGLVEASNARTDITLQEKREILRLRRTARINLVPSSVDILKPNADDAEFMQGHTSARATYPNLKDGVLTRWSSVNSPFTPMQLDVVQLPSPNLGICLKQWRLVEAEMNIKSYDIEPAHDLLVLQEYTGPAPEPHIGGDTPLNTDSFEIDDNPLDYYRFHFRTLSGNKMHPDAIVPKVDFKLRAKSPYGLHIECFGGLLLIRVPSYDKYRPGLLVYNWITGALLDRRDSLYSRHLALLTDQILVIPHYDHIRSESQPMGSLELYYIDWSDISSPTMTLTTSLKLPTRSSPSPIISEISCFGSRPARTPRSGTYVFGSPRIFEPSNASRLLRVSFILASLETGPMEARRQSCETSLYVPFEVIINIVRAALLDPQNDIEVNQVPWDGWGHRASWIHLDGNCHEKSRHSPVGSRCMILSQGAHRWDQTPENLDQHRAFDLYLLDFNLNFVENVALRSRLSNAEKGPKIGHDQWTYRSTGESQPPPVIASAEEHSWVTRCGFNKAAAPYAWSIFKHEYFDKDVSQRSHWVAMMDNEHIVVVEVREASKNFSSVEHKYLLMVNTITLDFS